MTILNSNIVTVRGFLRDSEAKESTWQSRRHRLDSWVGQTLGVGMATHSSALAWRVTWTEKPAGYSPRGHQRVGHDSETEQQEHNDSAAVTVNAGDDALTIAQKAANGIVLPSIWNGITLIKDKMSWRSEVTARSQSGPPGPLSHGLTLRVYALWTAILLTLGAPGHRPLLSALVYQ